MQTLNLASEFRRVREHGASCVGRWIILGFLRAPGEPVIFSSPGEAPPQRVRIGIIASRKLGGAVVRNKFRRRIRHIYRTHLPQIQGTPWLVIVARHGASRATFAQLDAEWCKLARKAGFL